MSKAASAVARKKGYGGTSKGFHPLVPLYAGRRTLVRRPAKYMRDKRTETREERRSSEKEPFLDGN